MSNEFIINSIAKDILKLTNHSPELAREVATTLASFDWQQVISEHQQEEVDSQMWAMKDFLRRIEEGQRCCDGCDEDNYVGGYHHGPLYTVLYSWPHSISVDSYLKVEWTQGKLFCRQCLRRWQDKSKNQYLFQENYLAWHNEMLTCNECQRLIPRKSSYSISQVHDYRYYCLHCIGKVVDRTFLVCTTCGKKTLNYTQGKELCHDCIRNYPHQLSVFTHLARARLAGNAATLTPAEWINTVNHFNTKCAYCRLRPFEVLEHFLPITLGGGTTFDNCIPACKTCNSKKSNRHPDTLTSVI